MVMQDEHGDARFILVLAAWPYVQQRGAKSTVYLAPVVLVVGIYKHGERGREAPKSLARDARDD